MPKVKCKSNGKTGVKYGNSGKCYVGKNKESKMYRQMRAMYANGYRKK